MLRRFNWVALLVVYPFATHRYNLHPSTEAHVQAGILVSTRGAFKVYKAPGTAKALNTPSTGSTLAQSSGMLYKDG